jgi:hypothetical protein
MVPAVELTRRPILFKLKTALNRRERVLTTEAESM